MRSAVVFLLACHGQMAPEADAFELPPVSAVAERGFVNVGNSHMFYVLFPGEPTGPLFVLFNGGPGFPTTLGLLANNTAPNAVNAGSAIRGASRSSGRCSISISG